MFISTIQRLSSVSTLCNMFLNILVQIDISEEFLLLLVFKL